MPKVSVIIPSYNCGHILPATLDSVFAQTFEDYETIVIDDGSTDGTEHIIESYKHCITYLRGPNRGPAAARNKGLQNARGELIAFLDADDLWNSEKLNAQVALMNSHPEIGVSYTNFTFLGGGSFPRTGFEERDFALLRYDHEEIGESQYRLTSAHLLRDFLAVQAFPKPSVLMVRRCCFEQVGYFDESLPISEDTQMCLRLAKYFKFGYVDLPLAQRRVRTDSVSSTVDDRRYAGVHIQMFENLQKWIVLSKKEKNAADLNLSKYCFAAGYADFAEGRQNTSRHHFHRSLRFHFSLKTNIFWLMTFLPPAAVKTVKCLKPRVAR